MHFFGTLTRWRGALALAAMIATSAGCAPHAEAPPPRLIVVILADTLRADRVGAYGNERGLTPSIDSLARRSFVFHRAYAPAPWTAPSVASLFTSRLPSEVGIDRFASILQDGEATVAEAFHAHGYATGAFLGHWFMLGKGFEQGFDTYVQVYDPNAPKPRAAAVNAAALGWLDRVTAQGPVPNIFLYLHYVEPHVPYTPPPDTVARVWGDALPLDVDAINAVVHGGVTSTLSTDTVRRVEAAYDAEVLSLDESLGALFAALEMRGLLRDALVVFTADHGEGFQGYGYMGHSQSLFNELIRVPLIVHVPGLRERVDISEPVSLVDVSPTILDWSADRSPASFRGRSLRPIMLEHWLSPIRALWHRWTDTPQPVFSERANIVRRAAYPEHQTAVILGQQKYIAAGPSEAFYDLDGDPGERQPDALSPAARERLRAVLQAKSTVSAAQPERVPVDPGTAERLRALGYGDL